MDIEGTMQFILDQQAKFSGDIARIESVLQRTSELLANLAERQTTTEETTRSLGEGHNKEEQTILDVGQAVLDVANSQRRTNEILANLAERQTTTEEATESFAERHSKTEQIILEVRQT